MIFTRAFLPSNLALAAVILSQINSAKADILTNGDINNIGEKGIEAGAVLESFFVGGGPETPADVNEAIRGLGSATENAVNNNFNLIQTENTRIDALLDTTKSNSTAIQGNSRAIYEVQDNVNILGFGVAGATALSTALTALPTVADDSPVSCGVGTGGYSNRYAMSVGCAFKTTDRLSFNAGGSYVFGGAADYGNSSLSNVAGRAGFAFKLGKIQKLTSEDNDKLQTQIDEVMEENTSIKLQNNELIARLERLETFAQGRLIGIIEMLSPTARKKFLGSLPQGAIN